MSNVTEECKGALMVNYMPINALKPYKNNARIHSASQVQQIANSIKKFGFMNPVLINNEDMIMAGHGRVEAANKLGMKEVPTICTNHLSQAQIRAYIIADNKIAENAQWDKAILAMEFADLAEIDIDGFDIEDTGFAMAEVDLILDINAPQKSDPADHIPDTDNTHPITKSGDIWIMGKHRLICGDALKAATYETLMGGTKADMVFSDPPYNVSIDGHVCGNGKVKHQEFAMASGEMSDEQFYSFLHNACVNMHRYSRDGSLHYLCMDWRGIDLLLRAGKAHYTELKNICIWNKNNGGMGSLYRSKHEMVAVFKKGKAAHINNIELGTHGRYRTNVWDYAGVNSFGKSQSDLAMHPTVKPVALIADAIKDCTKRNNIVLDPFAGSGSTLIAAEKTGRISRCIELDPKYCDVIVKRWEGLTGKEAKRLRATDRNGSSHE